MQIICVCVCVRVYEEYLISILNVSQPDGTVLLGGGRGEGVDRGEGVVLGHVWPNAAACLPDTNWTKWWTWINKRNNDL